MLLPAPLPPCSLHPGFSSPSATSTFSLPPIGLCPFLCQQYHHTATKKPGVVKLVSATPRWCCLLRGFLNPPRPLAMHLDTLPSTFSPLLLTFHAIGRGPTSFSVSSHCPSHYQTPRPSALALDTLRWSLGLSATTCRAVRRLPGP